MASATSSRIGSKQFPRGGKDRIVDQEAAKYLPDDDTRGTVITESILAAPKFDTRTADADATAVKDAFLDGLPSPDVDVDRVFEMVELTSASSATLRRTSTAPPRVTTTAASPTPLHRAQSASSTQPQPQPLSLRRNVSLHRLATPPPRPSSTRLLDVPSVSRTHIDGEGDLSPVSLNSAFTDAGAVSPSNVPLLSGIAVPLPLPVSVAGAGKKGSVGSVASSWLGGGGGGGGSRATAPSPAPAGARSTHTHTHSRTTSTSISWRLSLSSLHPSLAASLAPTSSPTPSRPSTPTPPTCSICLTPFVPHSSIVRTLIPCGHVLHRACVDPWVAGRSGTCPVCRGVVGRKRGAPGDGEDGDGSGSGGGESESESAAEGMGQVPVEGEVRLAIDQ